MDVALLVHPAVPLVDLPEDGFELLLTKLAVCFELASQVALVTMLGNDVAVVHGGVGGVAAQQIRMVEALDALQFAVEHALGDVVAQRLQIDDLDGYHFICRYSSSYW